VIFRQSSSAFATSREGQCQPGSDRAVLHRQWEQEHSSGSERTPSRLRSQWEWVSWDISTEADTAAGGALSAGLGKPALRFGATVKRDGITTTAKQASNATVASIFAGLK